MLVLLTYDVNTTTITGAARLRKVAKLCENYGVRVQCSVFELLIDNTQLIQIKASLKKIINEESDSVRFYLVGNKWENKIQTMGVHTALNMNDTLIL